MRLPSPTRIQDPEVKAYLSELVQALERQYSKHPVKPFTSTSIKVTGVTNQYTFDCTAGTLADTRMVLGTLLVDLQGAGILP